MKKNKKTSKKVYIYIGATLIILGLLVAFGTKIFAPDGEGLAAVGSPMQLQWITDYNQEKIDSIKSGTDYEIETFTMQTAPIENYPTLTDAFSSLNPNAVFLDIVSRRDRNGVQATPDGVYHNPELSGDVYISFDSSNRFWSRTLNRIDMPIVAISGMGTCNSVEINRWGGGGSLNPNNCEKIGQPISDLCVGSRTQKVGGSSGINLKCVSPYPDGHFGENIEIWGWYGTSGNTYEVKIGTPKQEIPPELHFRYFTCPLNNNYQLVTESFSETHTINNFAVRYPVNYYCARFPVIKTSSVDFEGTVDTEIYPSLVNGDSYSIPIGETHTLFYVVDNNGQLPTICDPNGAIDPVTGKCVVSPGIIHICSQGQFDPALGMCAVQPESTYICEEGGYYDTAQAKCIYHPPVQAICEKGTFNVDRDVCEFSPSAENICDVGTYNPVTDNCEIYPEQMILCPGTYTYDPSSGLCMKYADSQVQCSGGGTYNDAAGVCFVTPPEQVVCDRGIYHNVLNVCVYTPDFTNYCPQGDYDTVLDACVIQPDLDYLCLRGTISLDPITGLRKCVIYPEITVYCAEIGGVYDADIDKCIVTPDADLICDEGVLETINGQPVCTVRPNVDVVCGNPEAHYVEELGVCQQQADLEYLCIEGDLVDHNDGSYGCALEATPEYQCVGGFEYDGEHNICVGSPTDARYSALAENIKTGGYSIAAIMVIIGMILLMVGL